MTIDLQDVSGDIEVPDQPNNPNLPRNHTSYGGYIRAHMRAGTAVFPLIGPPVDGCAVVLGPGVDPASVVACATLPMVDGTNAQAVPVQFADPLRVRVRTRTGFPGDRIPTRTAMSVTRMAGAGSPRSVRLNEFEVPGPVGPTGDPDQVIFDPSDNTLLLDDALRSGEWLLVRYTPVAVETLPAVGVCGATDPSTFNGRAIPGLLSFDPTINGVPTTIGGYLRRAFQTSTIGPAVLVTAADRALTFSYRTSGVLDTRLWSSTAQFVAGGSYGPLQASLKLWELPAARWTMQSAFSLRDNAGGGSRCLQELIDPANPNRFVEAFGIATAAQSYWVQRTSRPSFSDQLSWAQYWARVFENYNRNEANNYKRRGNDLNGIANEAVKTYGKNP